MFFARASFASILCAIFFCALVSSVYAESALWNRTYGPREEIWSIGLRLPGSYEMRLTDPSVTITYRAHMEDVETGALIPSGASIPVGKRVRFVFEPHVHTDISWFVAGYGYGSPYGDWRGEASAPPIACNDKDFVGNYQYPTYVALSVHPPVKALSGVSGFTCDEPDANDSRVCTATTPGVVNPVFTFGAPATIPVPTYDSGGSGTLVTPTSRGIQGTYGYFYPRVIRSSACHGGPNYAMSDNRRSGVWRGIGPAFVVDVPVLTIPFTLTILPEDPTQKPPTTPTLTSNGACVAGTPHTVTFSSTDENGDNLRYGIDWNSDESIDQWVPPTGYVPSGTAQTASRTYATAGTKTVQVLAQDEGGLTSPWATTSFSCAENPTPTPTDATAGLEGEDTGNEGTDPGTFLPAGPDLTLRVIPSLVRSGNTTRINWSATGVTSCIVTAPNGDSWNKITSILGGEVSRPITSETTYTLTCQSTQGPQTKQDTVRILPRFQEK